MQQYVRYLCKESRCSVDPHEGIHMTELKRTLGLWGAAGVGIGAIIGTGIFVLIGAILSVIAAVLSALRGEETVHPVRKKN
jgi:amino acid permease